AFYMRLLGTGPALGGLCHRRLDGSRVVRTPRQEHGLAAIPRPWKLKTSERDAKRRLRKPGVSPRAATIDRNLDATNGAASRPCEPVNRVEPFTRQPLSAGGERNNRFRALFHVIAALGLPVLRSEE